MKTLLVLLTFTFLSSSLAAVVTFSEFEKDLNNFEHLNFGVDALLNKGRQVGKIVDGLFDITRIYNISSELDYYDFIIQLDDSKESVIQATLRVQVEGNQATNVMSFSYTVTNTTSGTTETGTDADVPEIPPVEISNEETEISEIPNEEIDIDTETLPVEIPNEEADLGTEAPSVEIPNQETDIVIDILPGEIPNQETDIGTETPSVETPNEETDVVIDILPGEIPNQETDIGTETPSIETPNEETDIIIDTPPVEIPNQETDIGTETPSIETPNEETDISTETPDVTESGGGSQPFGLDPDVQRALDFGVQSLIQIGNNNGKIPSGENYEVTQVYNHLESSRNDRTYYDFDVEAMNDGGNIVIEMNFRVRETLDKEMKVVSFSYKVTKTTIRSNEPTKPDDVEPGEVGIGIDVPTDTSPPDSTDGSGVAENYTQEAQDFGVQSVLQRGYNQNKIKEGEDYQVTKVNNFNEEPGDNRVDYIFDLEVTNSRGNIIIQMTFTVRRSSDGEISLVDYDYQVSTRTSGDDDIGPDTEIPPSQYSSPEIREALTFGRDHVLQKGYDNGKIPTGESYYMSNINSIIQETGDNLVRYKFDITMENSNGNIIIQMKYTVSKSSSGNLKVVASEYETRTTS